MIYLEGWKQTQETQTHENKQKCSKTYNEEYATQQGYHLSLKERSRILQKIKAAKFHCHATSLKKKKTFITRKEKVTSRNIKFWKENPIHKSKYTVSVVPLIRLLGRLKVKSSKDNVYNN